jgi:hypothetical protein
VVSTEEIPIGPARAALAVHRDPGGVPTITLAVRPIQASHAVFYGLEEELRGEAGLAMGVDAALCFGESLGFLFVASGDVEAGGVFSLWSSIIGDDELSKVMQVTRSEPRAVAAPVLDTDLETDLGEELLLEELALEDMPEGELLAEDLAPEPPARTEAAPTPTLTKFRALADPSPEPRPDSEEPPRRALLARVRLVKRAAKPEKPSLEPDPELGRSLRLLTSF